MIASGHVETRICSCPVFEPRQEIQGPLGDLTYIFLANISNPTWNVPRGCFDGIVLLCMGTLTWAEWDGHNDPSFILVMTHPGFGGSGVETQLCLVSNPSYCRDSRDLCEPCRITGKESRVSVVFCSTAFAGKQIGKGLIIS